ncbi:MAG: MOSC domain-containing protein [Acidobacteriota bacterium]
MAAEILQQAVGRPVTYEADGSKPWTSSIFKEPTDLRIALRETHLEGDEVADRRHHGGADKAVLAYGARQYEAWSRGKSGPSYSFPWGAFGENWTVSELSEDSVFLGDVFAVGSARVQVSQPRQPCWKLSRRWKIRDLTRHAQESGRLGWYLRVLEVGEVAVGDALELLERPLPDWPLERLNDLKYRDRKNARDAAFLAECPLLAEAWRKTFRKRASAA